jgi:hypothetical protein
MKKKIAFQINHTSFFLFTYKLFRTSWKHVLTPHSENIECIKENPHLVTEMFRTIWNKSVVAFSVLINHVILSHLEMLKMLEVVQ